MCIAVACYSVCEVVNSDIYLFLSSRFPTLPWGQNKNLSISRRNKASKVK